MARLIQYIKDTRGEMKHVSWPTSQQTIAFTILVIAISLVTAAYLGVLDTIFTGGLENGLDALGGSASAPETTSPTLDIDAVTETGEPAELDITTEPVEGAESTE